MKVLVTGASGGIGETVAIALAMEGASVAIAARRETELRRVARNIKAMGGSVTILPTDLRDRKQILSMIEDSVAELGGLDVLVNNAGVGHWEAIADAEIDKWRDEVEVNLLAPMYATRFAVDVMLKQLSGHVVVVSSLAGRFPGPGYPGYTASKSGLNAFTDSVLYDLSSKGIRVTLIEPGEVDTAMQSEEDRGSGKFLEPEDIADAIIFALTRPKHVCVSNIALVRSSMPEEGAA